MTWHAAGVAFAALMCPLVAAPAVSVASTRATANVSTPAPAGTGTRTSSGAGAGVTVHGLAVTVTVKPSRVGAGTTVKVKLAARAKHASGALEYSLSYGDGHRAPPVMVPQYCIAAPGPPAHAVWRFRHRYRTPGTYRIRARVAVNCGGPSAKVAVSVHVHGKASTR